MISSDSRSQQTDVTSAEWDPSVWVTCPVLISKIAMDPDSVGSASRRPFGDHRGFVIRPLCKSI
jgi:hypothetical protein